MESSKASPPSLSRPVRIVHLTATAIGAPWMVALAREQRRLGHDVSVIVPSTDGSIARQLAVDQIACYAAPTDLLSLPSHLQKVRAIVTLVRMLRRLKPDVVHSHILNSVVTARIASWIADVPMRFGGNVGPLSIESDLLRPLEIGTAFCDTKTIASCTHTRDLFLRYGVPAEQVELIFYAVDQSGHDPALADGPRVRRELGIPDHAPVIGKIAYFYPPSHSAALMPSTCLGRGLKGHDVLLRAVPRVLEAYPDARFVLVGRGWGPAGEAYARDLKEMARAEGVAHAVLFPGERTDVPDTLAAFDISVHCSLNDNLAGTVESLLLENPMVVSNIPGFADTVRHEDTGLVVPVDDPSALADAIIRLLRDPALARRLGANGRRRMLGRFTLAHMVAGVERLIAGSTARAEQHYRLTTTAARAMMAPFKLFPVAREVRRVLRDAEPRARLAAGPGAARLSVYRAKDVVRAAIKRTIRPPAASGVLPRMAHVVGASEGCAWFVDMCRSLVERHHDLLAVIDSGPGDLGARLEAAGVRCRTARIAAAGGVSRSRVPLYAAQVVWRTAKLSRMLRREQIGIVHSHGFDAMMAGRPAALLARGRHVSMIDACTHFEAPLTRMLDRQTWWLDDVTIAGSGAAHRRYQALGLSEERLACIQYDSADHRAGSARLDRPVGGADMIVQLEAVYRRLAAADGSARP